MELTTEQLAIREAALSTKANLQIVALAGAAKTTSLVMVAEALAPTRMMCLAFNKTIATEMQKRLPASCEAKTLNGLGHGIWKATLGRGLVLDKDKIYNLVSRGIEGWSQDEKSLVYENMAEVLQTIRYGKACGWIPEGSLNPRTGKPVVGLLEDDEFFNRLDEEPADWLRFLVLDVSKKSFKMAWEGNIDYDDQILMPTLCPSVFPRFPIVLIDEAQDLSNLNHVMLRKLVGDRRLIAVGDPNQAIYGFRGAHADSMRVMRDAFQMEELHLTITFRCPKRIVEESRWRAPAMQWAPWAKDGEVKRLHQWDAEDVPADAAILCRNNAPLFSAAVKLLKAGRPCELSGNDIGKALMKVMKKFGPQSMPKAEVLGAIEQWREEKLAKSRVPGSIHDRAECMIIFAEMGDTLGAALGFAEHIFSSMGSIKLMTGHKSKGFEFEHVFILDQFLLSKEGQDPNLKYVMQTRAKQTLTYIRSEDYVD